MSLIVKPLPLAWRPFHFDIFRWLHCGSIWPFSFCSFSSLQSVVRNTDEFSPIHSHTWLKSENFRAYHTLLDIKFKATATQQLRHDFRWADFLLPILTLSESQLRQLSCSLWFVSTIFNFNTKTDIAYRFPTLHDPHSAYRKVSAIFLARFTTYPFFWHELQLLHRSWHSPTEFLSCLCLHQHFTELTGFFWHELQLFHRSWQLHTDSLCCLILNQHIAQWHSSGAVAHQSSKILASRVFCFASVKTPS